MDAPPWRLPAQARTIDDEADRARAPGALQVQSDRLSKYPQLSHSHSSPDGIFSPEESVHAKQGSALAASRSHGTLQRPPSGGKRLPALPVEAGQNLRLAKLPPLRGFRQEPHLDQPFPPLSPLSPAVASGPSAGLGAASRHVHRGHTGKHSRKLDARLGVPAPLDHQTLKNLAQMEALPATLGGSSSSSSPSFLQRSCLNSLDASALSASRDQAHDRSCKVAPTDNPPVPSGCPFVQADVPAGQADVEQEQVVVPQRQAVLQEQVAVPQEQAVAPDGLSLVPPSQTTKRQQCTLKLLGNWKRDHEECDNTSSAVAMPPPLHVAEPADPSCMQHREPGPPTHEGWQDACNSARDSEWSRDDSDSHEVRTFYGRTVGSTDEVVLDDDVLSDASGEGWVFESDAGRKLASACNFVNATPRDSEGDSDSDTEMFHRAGHHTALDHESEMALANACAGNAVNVAVDTF